MDELEFTNSADVLDSLSITLGKMIKSVTGYKVVDAEATVTRPDGNFILVDMTSLTPVDWETNEIVDGNGVVLTAHNYTASYTLTAYKGKPHWALSRVHQAFGLPYLREKYFPTGSPYSYSSSSTISRMRVPRNQQEYETRARILINFNVCFVEMDTGAFEEVERIQIGITAENTSGPPIGIVADTDVNITPGGDDSASTPETDPDNPNTSDNPISYKDKVVEVLVEPPSIDNEEFVSSENGD